MIGGVTLELRTRSTLNQREHWSVRAKRTKRERRTTKLMLRARLGAPTRLDLPRNLNEELRQRVLLKRIAPRALDDDNLRGALKAIRDEVAAYLEVDDGSDLVEWLYDQGKSGEPGVYAVLVQFEETPR